MSPCSAQVARYSPFSVTLACVQVRPDRYQTIGSFTPLSAWGGRKIENVMSVEVALDACFTTSCRPPCDLLSETISTLIRPASCEVRKACCRQGRADTRGTAGRTSLGECRADPRPT